MEERADRECPNGWSECTVCKYERDCRAGLYKGEENILIKAAEISEEVVMSEAVESAISIKRNMHREFMAMSTEECMNWFYGYRVQGLHHVEVMPLDGPSAPGGGGKVKVKKSKTGNKIFVNAWDGF